MKRVEFARKLQNANEDFIEQILLCKPIGREQSEASTSHRTLKTAGEPLESKGGPWNTWSRQS